MITRLNQYRVLWILVLFDLPTETKRDRKAADIFRKNLLRDGFAMFQFSIYLRHCSSRENCDVHLKRVKNWLPEKGHIIIFTITDKQFGEMEIYKGQEKAPKKAIPQQLELF